MGVPKGYTLYKKKINCITFHCFLVIVTVVITCEPVHSSTHVVQTPSTASNWTEILALVRRPTLTLP